jgi:hypothetical protein
MALPARTQSSAAKLSEYTMNRGICIPSLQSASISAVNLKPKLAQRLLSHQLLAPTQPIAFTSGSSTKQGGLIPV